MPIRRSANLVLLFLVVVGFIIGSLIVVSMLGAFLLPLTFVFVFLLIIYFTGGTGFSGPQIILGIIVLFMFGYGAHLFLGSTINLSTIKLSTVGYSISDSEFNTVLGFIAIITVVALAFAGLFVSAQKRR